MRHRPLAVAVAGGLALVVAALLVATPAAGPLGVETGAPNRLSFAVDPGRSFSYGLIVLQNRSSADARLLGVDLVAVSGGLELRSAAVRRLREAPDHGLVANARTYPPESLRDVLQSAIGAAVPPFREPEDGVELVLELRATGDGTSTFSSVAVRYEQGGRRYRAVFPAALLICTPRLAACPP